MPHRYPMEFYAIDGKHFLPSSQLLIKGLSEEQYQALPIAESTGVQKRSRKIQADVLPPPINFNLRNDKPDPLYEDPNYHLGDPDIRTHFFDEELEYFHKNGNNVTFFIHGYNIEYGAYGKHIHTIHSETLLGLQNKSAVNKVHCTDQIIIGSLGIADVQFSKDDATTYRSIERLQQTYPALELIAPYPEDLSILQLNGTGAHNWLIHIEHNLNCAAGFDGIDYRNYTRIVGIFWQGNPIHALDYISAEKHADSAALKMLSLIEQLHNYNRSMSINIIAHSLGCRVLIKLMDELGKKPNYYECLDFAILWQAAIPDTAFSIDKKLDTSFNQNNYFPNAYKAAKRINILYSYNDNLLGPIAIQDSAKTNFNQEDIETWFSIHAIQKIDKFGIPTGLKCGYNIAQMLGVPLTTLLLDQHSRARFYQDWCRKQFGSKAEIPSLASQTQVLKTKSPIEFNAYAYLFSAYTAALKHCFTEFLFNPKFKSKLDRLLIQITSSALTKLLHTYIPEQVGKYSYVSMPKWAKDICDKLLGYSTHSPIEKDELLLGWARDGLLYSHFERFFSPEAQSQDWLDNVGIETATLFLTILNTPNAQPRPAMGYSGPARHIDKHTDELITSGKINLLDQTGVLLSHSGMKAPSKNLISSVYKDTIINAKNFKFGKYN